ncbi:uncharacterized protein Tco025E_04306 [Trypanosoma conorhini]|uniref:Uncharacterized protein n=1 Tax=Trypanosoma conorhini TaxID=83891 RepID=A0A422PN97_9TRYP|nr:uncharacterized protein Tco025E_04306 [Trypanosoma conorhini]RNF19173.1 hypothetical protein Tco025E_04306 [Trypanosoma conorhini]
MHSAAVESCLAHACERRAEAVLCLAEEAECGPLRQRWDELPLFFRILVTAYLVRNDVVNATWAVRRWERLPAHGDRQAEGYGCALLGRVARLCGRCAYGEAFREVLGAVGGGAEGCGVEHLRCWLLDYLAARHVHQRRTFYGDSGALVQLAAGLGVPASELEARLQRVRGDELRHIECGLSDGPCEQTRETLCCMVRAGKAV